MRSLVLSMTDVATYLYCRRAFALYPLSGKGKAPCLPCQAPDPAESHREMARVFVALARAAALGRVPGGWRLFGEEGWDRIDALHVEEPVQVPVGPGLGLCGIPDLWWDAGSEVVIVEWKAEPWELTGFQMDFYAAITARAAEKNRAVAVEIDTLEGPGALRVYTEAELARIWESLAKTAAEILERTARLYRGWDLDELFPARKGCDCRYDLTAGAEDLPGFPCPRGGPCGLSFDWWPKDEAPVAVKKQARPKKTVASLPEADEIDEIGELAAWELGI